MKEEFQDPLDHLEKTELMVHEVMMVLMDLLDQLVHQELLAKQVILDQQDCQEILVSKDRLVNLESLEMLE